MWGHGPEMGLGLLDWLAIFGLAALPVLLGVMVLIGALSLWGRR